MYLRLALLLILLPAVVAAEPLRVFTSVLPLKTFVEQVGGEHVEVQAMVRPGYNPHTYEPTPQQISALSGAALYVSTGVPFERVWMMRIRAVNPDMVVLDARSGIELRGSAHGGHDHDHGHESDPHVWTSPPLVRPMAGAIRAQLTALDPANAGAYRRNRDAFVRELDTLDRDIRALLDPLPNRRFMVFHPAWGYFADAYDLVQVPIEREGKEPGARGLAALIEQAQREDIRVVFVQPQFDRRQARQVADAIGGSVIAVDPLAEDYIPNLRVVAQQFAAALQP